MERTPATAEKHVVMLDTFAGYYLRIDMPASKVEGTDKKNVKLHVHQAIGEKEVDFAVFIENNDEGLLARIYSGTVDRYPEAEMDDRIATAIFNSEEFNATLEIWLAAYQPASFTDELEEENEDDYAYDPNYYWGHLLLKEMKCEKLGDPFKTQICLDKVVGSIIPRPVELTLEQQKRLIEASLAYLNEIYAEYMHLVCCNVTQKGKNTYAQIEGSIKDSFKQIFANEADPAEEFNCAYDYWASVIYDIVLEALDGDEYNVTVLLSEIFDEFIPEDVILTPQQKESIIRLTLAHMRHTLEDFNVYTTKFIPKGNDIELRVKGRVCSF